MDKWDRLYNYLNDRALGIAPDERMSEEEKHDATIIYTILHQIIDLMIDMEANDDRYKTN